MPDALDLGPRWWREEVSALLDVDAHLLFDGTCARCHRRRGVRVVHLDVAAGVGEPPIMRWCTRCLLLDFPRRILR